MIDDTERMGVFGTMFGTATAATLTAAVGPYYTATETAGLILVLSALSLGLWAVVRFIRRWLP